MELKPNPRALRNEAGWLPRNLDDALEVRRRVLDAGHSASVASGLMAWLIAKAAGQEDSTAGPTRWRYRKILAELGPGPHDGSASVRATVGEVKTARRAA